MALAPDVPAPSSQDGADQQELGSSCPVKRKRSTKLSDRFNIQGNCARKQRTAFPGAAEIQCNAPIQFPKESIEVRLENPCIIIGFDCETHDWLDGTPRKGRIGAFGWHTKNDDVDFARIVQLGWAIGPADSASDVITKSHVVRPEGFNISSRAEKVHKISTDHAMREGRPLADVLEEFMHDVLNAVNKGGRVCAHQLEFDAGVVANEMFRSGQHDLRKRWCEVAKRGYCTMNPQIPKWVNQTMGNDPGPDTAKPMLGLIALAKCLRLIPEDESTRHHSAAYDAEMTRRIYIMILSRVRSQEPDHL